MTAKDASLVLLPYHSCSYFPIAWYSFTYPEQMESCVSLGRKEGCKKIQISAELGIKLRTLWSKSRVLTNCTNHTCLCANMKLSPEIFTKFIFCYSNSEFIAANSFNVESKKISFIKTQYMLLNSYQN